MKRAPPAIYFTLIGLAANHRAIDSYRIPTSFRSDKSHGCYGTSPGTFSMFRMNNDLQIQQSDSQ